MFNAAQYEAMYDRFLGPLAQDVTLQVKEASGYANHVVKAHVSNWRETDLVPNGSIKLGDLRVIIKATSLPTGLRPLEQKDRIQINGRVHAVINWDANKRSVGDQVIAVEATVRG